MHAEGQFMTADSPELFKNANGTTSSYQISTLIEGEEVNSCFPILLVIIQDL